jgi:hypothetical protein
MPRGVKFGDFGARWWGTPQYFLMKLRQNAVYGRTEKVANLDGLKERIKIKFRGGPKSVTSKISAVTRKEST